MSDSDEEEVVRQDFKDIADEIDRCKKNPETSGMFVSGWDDDDQDIQDVTNPKGK